ncbi:MAG: Endonuclease YhcR precursor [Candidatus Hydrogenedentes bacterium ADurb.Bin179]|nr:MAG: Endonuclease YhcR precursor [Candidatus Hydrogenedentes bacterium ADurb.Bin179]
MMLKKSITLIVACLCLCLSAGADTGKVLILYTSDMHDYIKPGPDNLGGLPYVAGHVASVRETRDDILLFDGGDVMEKGDMVSFTTQSRIMYEAMKKIGYTAGAVGNHDLTYGLDHLRACSELSGMDHLCLNYYDESGTPYFPASKIYEVNGAKVGVIGLTTIKGGSFLDLPECGNRVAAEAARLKQEGAHLVVVIAHVGSSDLAKLAPLAPEVDLFFGGHNHEVLKEPRPVPETGALILMAGQYARYVVHMEVTLDLDAKRILDRQMALVAMEQDKISLDKDMMAWVHEEELKYCPEASEVVGSSNTDILPNRMARVAAEALKRQSGADAAFCHPGQIMRSSLPAGDIDANLLFRTGGQRGSEVVQTELTGEQIQAYLGGLAQERKGQTEWAGFRAEIRYNRKADQWTAATDLEPSKRYKVVLPKLEWDSRLKCLQEKVPSLAGLGEPSTLELTFTRALVAYVKDVTAQGKTLDAHLVTLQ